MKNNDEIKYSLDRHYHNLLGMYLDTYTIEKMFFALDDKFETIRDLKEKYITFNGMSFSNNEETKAELESLIKEYEASDISIFKDFAEYLNKYKNEIINSFAVYEVIRRTADEQEAYYARLSNGPMEGFNRKPKDYKRNSRGFSNFDYTRNRILWSTRKNPAILGNPKTYKQIHSYKGTPRGSYKK